MRDGVGQRRPGRAASAGLRSPVAMASAQLHNRLPSATPALTCPETDLQLGAYLSFSSRGGRHSWIFLTWVVPRGPSLHQRTGEILGDSFPLPSCKGVAGKAEGGRGSREVQRTHSAGQGLRRSGGRPSVQGAPRTRTPSLHCPTLSPAWPPLPDSPPDPERRKTPGQALSGALPAPRRGAADAGTSSGRAVKLNLESGQGCRLALPSAHSLGDHRQVTWPL